MNDLALFAMLGNLDDDIIADTCPPDLLLSAAVRPPRREAGLGQWMNSGWAAAILSTIVAIGVLVAVVLAGQRGPGTGPAGESGGSMLETTDPSADTETSVFPSIPIESSETDETNETTVPSLDPIEITPALDLPAGASIQSLISRPVEAYGYDANDVRLHFGSVLLRVGIVDLPETVDDEFHGIYPATTGVYVDMVHLETWELMDSLIFRGYVTVMSDEDLRIGALQFYPFLPESADRRGMACKADFISIKPINPSDFSEGLRFDRLIERGKFIYMESTGELSIHGTMAEFAADFTTDRLFDGSHGQDQQNEYILIEASTDDRFTDFHRTYNAETPRKETIVKYYEQIDLYALWDDLWREREPSEISNWCRDMPWLTVTTSTGESMVPPSYAAWEVFATTEDVPHDELLQKGLSFDQLLRYNFYHDLTIALDSDLDQVTGGVPFICRAAIL